MNPAQNIEEEPLLEIQRWQSTIQFVGESVSDFIAVTCGRQWLYRTAASVFWRLLFSYTPEASKDHQFTLQLANCLIGVYSSKTKFHR